MRGKPYEVGIDGRRACKCSRPTNISPKMSHTDRMLWEHVTVEVERGIAEGQERVSHQGRERGRGHGKEGGGEETRDDKACAKDAEKLRKPVLKSLRRSDSARDR